MTQIKKFTFLFPDGTLISGVSNPPVIPSEEEAFLKKRLQELEDTVICPICMESQKNRVFQCGHATCGVCADSLRHCPICRKLIKQKINLFWSEISARNKKTIFPDSYIVWRCRVLYCCYFQIFSKFKSAWLLFMISMHLEKNLFKNQFCELLHMNQIWFGNFQFFYITDTLRNVHTKCYYSWHLVI